MTLMMTKQHCLIIVIGEKSELGIRNWATTRIEKHFDLQDIQKITPLHNLQS